MSYRPRFSLVGEVTEDKLEGILEGIGPSRRSAVLHISSPGGDLDAAYRFYEEIRKCDIALHTYVHEQASSAAFLVFLAGVKRTAVGQVECLLHPSVFIPHEKGAPMDPAFPGMDRRLARVIEIESGGELTKKEAYGLINQHKLLSNNDLTKFHLVEIC